MKRLSTFFFRTGSGREPVRDWLLDLSKADREIVGEDIKDVEFGWPIGMPLCRPLGGGLHEVRSRLPGGRIARVIFCVSEERIVLLHAFFKTTQKTPLADLNLAKARQKELLK